MQSKPLRVYYGYNRAPKNQFGYRNYSSIEVKKSHVFILCHVVWQSRAHNPVSAARAAADIGAGSGGPWAHFSITYLLRLQNWKLFFCLRSTKLVSNNLPRNLKYSKFNTAARGHLWYKLTYWPAPITPETNSDSPIKDYGKLESPNYSRTTVQAS